MPRHLTEAEIERRHFDPAQRDAFFRIDGSDPKDDYQSRLDAFFEPDPTVSNLAPNRMDPAEAFVYRCSDDRVYFVGTEESEAYGYFAYRDELLSKPGAIRIKRRRNYWGHVRPRGL